MLLDIDGNGSVGAFTDGVLILRYLIALRGLALISGAVSLDALRKTAADIEAYLGQVIERFDIDDNGTLGAFSDGVMMARFMTGLRGEALISGAVASDANRTTAEEIEAYLEELANQTADPPSLFTTIAPDALPDQPPNTNDPSIIRQQFVAVDFNPLVAADSREGSQTLNLNLFEDASFDVIFDSAELSSDNSSLVRVGTVEGEADSEVYIVNSTADNIAIGNIRVGDKFYQIRFIDDGIHAVREIDQTVFVDEPEIEPEFEPDEPVAIADGSSTVDDGSIIDVMVVYSPAARQAAGGTAAMNQLIALAEAETNQGYANSGVIQRIRIVHSEEVPYRETSTNAFGNALNALTDGRIDNVQALRNIHSADMVSLWIDDLQYCGVAWLMQNPSYNFESRGFSVVSQSCATGYYTFAHELGHNQGVTHNREDAGGQASFPYAYGYRDPDRAFRTIMAYDDRIGYPRINYWSNPALTYNGKPLGIPGQTDNTRALNNNRIFVANWRHSNDNFIKAKVLDGSSITTTALNVNGTKEASEPNHAGNRGGRSVWWSWTAPDSGSVTITTVGSDFDTILGVYTGNSLFGLAPIASNDDSRNGVTTSSVTFNAVGGRDYKIAVDGFDGAIGNITLNLNLEQNVSINNPPIAANDAVSIIAGNSATIAILNNDFDRDGDPIFIDSFATISSAGGTVTQSGNSLIYTPAFGFAGNDSFNYTIADGNGGTDSATVSVTVERENQPPIAIDDFASTQENTPVSIPAFNNDSDPDGDGLFLEGISSSTAFGGSVSFQGDAILYTPAFGFAGTDSFSYTIADENGSTDSATVSVTVERVEPANQPPIAVDDFASTEENTPVSIPAFNNDSDPDGDGLFLEGISSSTAFGGSVSFQGDAILYTPAFGFAGTDSFSYTLSDGNGGTDSATVSVTVEEAPVFNFPPIAIDDSASTEENTSVNIFVLDNDLDLDSDALSIVDFSSTSASGGSISISNNGTAFDTSDDFLIYTPSLGYAGIDSFSYTIYDGGNTDTASVSVTVISEPTGPTNPDDPGNTLATAFNISPLSSTPQTFTNSVSSVDPGDIYRVDLASRSQVGFSIFANGSVNAQVIVDRNNNGQIDTGETPITSIGNSSNTSTTLNAGTSFIGIFATNSATTEYTLTVSLQTSSRLFQDRLTGISASDMLVGTKQEDLPSDASEGFVEMSNSFTTETIDLLEFSDPNSLTALGTAGNAVNANLPDLSTNSADGFTTYTDGTSSLVVDDNLIQNVLT